jgi:hypothetical protein
MIAKRVRDEQVFDDVSLHQSPKTFTVNVIFLCVGLATWFNSWSDMVGGSSISLKLVTRCLLRKNHSESTGAVPNRSFEIQLCGSLTRRRNILRRQQVWSA